ncbi:helicase-related protein [Flavobacterium weaverense]|uniref:Helicase-like protein n=1 Tax=Flavobacterium weaverense TaxID=271156 RepID=A0A3L9ZXG7_9FLAO|nr:helicase-related protein [Flavobacterium weaverense]RMA75095.1 helicase-like protein [Flavobacterium weaverense]
MNDFRKKRKSLELFVREQIIGPGAFNNRFFFLEKWDTSEFNGIDFKVKNINAIDNKSEILAEVPAYQYSSAILFPETRVSKGTETQLKEKFSESDIDGENPDTEDIEKGGDDDRNIDNTEESLVSKQQNYPNSFGLSFVVGKETNLQDDLTVSVSFRKYHNINKKECFSSKLSCLVSEYDNEIEIAIENYFKPLFTSIRKNNNLFICLNQEINKNNIYDVDYIHLNNYFQATLLKTIGDIFKTEIVELKQKNGVIYYGIKGDYDLQFYSISESINYSGNEYKNVASLYDNSIINHIKSKLKEDLSNYSYYKKLIKEIEIFNQLKNYVTDLKSVYKPRNSSPIWEAKTFENILISLPKHDGTSKIFRLNNQVIDNNIKEVSDLIYSVQYIRKYEEIFVKILLINKANIILKENEPPQLNKKDEANLKAYFGIQLKVDEIKENTLKQYNPPQLLDFDEEDNFNKLLYRNFHDFGEGYNTSVNWGNVNKCKFIITEFLPEQETPKVDFKPSKIVNGKIVSRIENDSILSMRYLSTLSDVTDSDVLEGLKDFVNEYKIWIEEKQKNLNNENLLKGEEKELLKKQLLACDKDYIRLVRNIKLLSNDSKAMAAFRLMNTAMFMQLHHSIKKPFTPTSNTEEFYKNINLGGNDYKWRSFQITFILLNIDAFVRPDLDDKTVENIFSNGWPERNEIADLVWFPTGGGKTEAYLGIIAFVIGYRRFTNGERGTGTTVLMRYTLRLLTLQQFQRATMLICALEAIRKDSFSIPNSYSLGVSRITIGLFVGSGSLPNQWKETGNSNDTSMEKELQKIGDCIQVGKKVSTNLPFTECPWCGSDLFIEKELNNVATSSPKGKMVYGVDDQLNICCNNSSCTFKGRGRNRPHDDFSLPLRLFDEDIYKFPPTLLFGTVDKFAALANNVSTNTSERNKDSRRLFGKGYNHDTLPPELIIQDELHLLLGPLGSAVGLFEKSIDYLCTENGIKPKIVTSTATTRNTDKQIFALFNRRSEIFPKQGIVSDDSFFAYYERYIDENNDEKYISNRKYLGILPVGKTQVWMQLRIASISLTHRLKYLKECYTNDEIFEKPELINEHKDVFDYYHTVLSYFNSLKDVGKTQSQLSHYLPGDVNFVTKNTVLWSFLDKLIRNESNIDYSELTGRLTGEDVKSNLSNIEKKWNLISNEDNTLKLNSNNPPEFVISTNMISVGIDVSRFNTMIISSMPRNIAEYIQASSRVARSKEGIVFTVHHPFRSRDISHYQKFKEFHEKFYSYVEPISVTPFASKAMERYLAMFLSVMIRHDETLMLMNNADASNITDIKINQIKEIITNQIIEIETNAIKLDNYLKSRTQNVISSVDGIISEEELIDLNNKVARLLNNWFTRLQGSEPIPELSFYKKDMNLNSLFIRLSDNNYPDHWKVGYSLREIDPSVVIKTVQQ